MTEQEREQEQRAVQALKICMEFCDWKATIMPMQLMCLNKELAEKGRSLGAGKFQSHTSWGFQTVFMPNFGHSITGGAVDDAFFTSLIQELPAAENHEWHGPAFSVMQPVHFTTPNIIADSCREYSLRNWHCGKLQGLSYNLHACNMTPPGATPPGATLGATPPGATLGPPIIRELLCVEFNKGKRHGVSIRIIINDDDFDFASLATCRVYVSHYKNNIPDMTQPQFYANDLPLAYFTRTWTNLLGENALDARNKYEMFMKDTHQGPWNLFALTNPSAPHIAHAQATAEAIPVSKEVFEQIWLRPKV